MLESVMTMTAEQLGELVDEWHFVHFHGSAVARDTEVWNLVHAAKEALKQQLAETLTMPTVKSALSEDGGLRGIGSE